jgi:hypothetical protein
MTYPTFLSVAQGTIAGRELRSGLSCDGEMRKRRSQPSPQCHQKQSNSNFGPKPTGGSGFPYLLKPTQRRLALP